ncbi:glycine betaine/L-proline ABC transporter ATP-binding protein [Oleispirillum naphthae]|uniref:quaternary amine ABC transporter ATP-binding protein n=1 Tax=Oleispirillum naphthae TaxID=2838853 RepID=UPI0030825FAB
MALIEVRNVSKIFGPRPKSVLPLLEAGRSKTEILAETGHGVGLRNINLDIEAGQIFVVMGLSGSGKSTLIRHLNRLIDPTAGEILYEGEDILGYDKNQLIAFRRKKMSMVFQRFGLMPHWTVLENVAFGLKVQGVARAMRRERAAEWLDAVGLAGYEDSYPEELSGGMQQRVGLARALCTDAEVLLMDEAFSALDPLIRSEMQDQLTALQARLHKTIVFITHDLDEALRLGDMIAILKDGELVQAGPPAEILLRPADAYVESFVRDVNRVRVLTADTVMKPPRLRITTENMDEALRQMRASPHDFAYVKVRDGDEERYGVVTQAALEEARRSRASLRDIMCELPSIPLSAPVEDILAVALQADFPVPVINDAGEIKGVVTKKAVIGVISDQAEARAARAEEALSPEEETPPEEEPPPQA